MEGPRREKILRGEHWEVIRLRLGPYENNAYVVKETRAGCAVLVDAPWDPKALLQDLYEYTVAAILLTHAHPDHLLALAEVRAATGAPVGIHALEPEASDLTPEMWLEEGEVISVGHFQIRVLHTPGHTAGSVTFLLEQRAAFCGDTIFPGGPGRTWSPEGFQEILRSLESKIYSLPEDVLLLPGHGEPITVGESKKEYTGFLARGPRGGLWGEVRWDGV